LNKKIVMTVFVAAGMFANLHTVQAEAEIFNDLTEHWSKRVVEKAISQKYVDGYPDGTFKPDTAISRAEFIKMLMAAMNKEVVIGSGEWYQPYLNTSIQTGIHRAADFTEDLNGPISRGEMVRLIVRATNAELQKATVSMDDKEFIYSAAKKGLIQGLTDGRLGLNESTTRAQALTVMDRVLHLNDGGVLPVDPAGMQYADLLLTGSNLMTVLGKATDKKFPLSYPAGDVGVKLDEVIVIAPGDHDSPYASLVQANQIQDHYLLIFKIVWDLRKLRTDIQISDYFQVAPGDPNSIQLSGPQYAIYNETGFTESKVIASFTKEQFDDYMANDNLELSVVGRSYPLFFKIK
jgi:hypothetical protein